MATVFWTGNQAAVAQVETYTIAGTPAVSNTLIATLNTKTVTYTLTGSDTAITSTAAFLALLQACTFPEFTQLTFASPTTTTISATANTPGVPFANLTGGLVMSAGGGGVTITTAHTVANSSPNDAGATNNWLRSGSPGIPQDNDTVILQNSSVSILYNLAALAAVKFASYTRYQSYTGTIGLPFYNPLGYQEYLPIYFKFVGATNTSTALPVNIGVPDTSESGPPFEQYDVGAQTLTLNAYAGNIILLSTSVTGTMALSGANVTMGLNPGETGNFATANISNGGSLTLGSGITVATSVTLTNSTLTAFCIVPTITATQGGNSINLSPNSGTFTTIDAENGSTVTYTPTGTTTITTLTLKTSSTFNKGQSPQALTITNSTVDGDTCQIVDPLNTITFTNFITVNNLVTSGPVVFGPGKTMKVV